MPNDTSKAASGSTSIQAGVDYLGTVRVRLGYLWSQTLLAYGTAGFAYGGAWANVVQAGSGQYTYGVGMLPAAFAGQSVGSGQTITGGGISSQLLTGWTAGSGLEWMFLPN